MAGQGKKTSFDGMTHEQMLSWLDDADAGTVQAAADKLASAAKEIHSIADELKIRPQWVKWKGEGADSFRQWAGKLANATVALGDYSQDSSKWLGHAAQAISTAKTSVPRDKNVDANIDAARSAHNDPDAQSVLTKNMAVRQQTADEMDKLGQAYSLSSSQMAAARKPDLLKFPPPPVAIQDPEAVGRSGGSHDLATGQSRPTARAAYESTDRRVTPARTAEVPTASGANPHTGVEASSTPAVDEVSGVVPAVPEPATHLNVDSVATLPQATQTPPVGTPPTTPGPVAPVPGGPATPGPVPPAYGITGTPKPIARATGSPVTGRANGGPVASGSSARPTGPSAPGVSGRPSQSTLPGQGATSTGRGPGSTGQPGTSTGRAPGSAAGRGPAQGGITGGRPQQTTGRPTTGVPRGTVMGTEGAGGGRGTTGARGPADQSKGVSSSRPTTTGSTSRGTGPGRLSAGAGGEGGVIGGQPSRQQRGNKAAFTRGGSGLVRSQGMPGAVGEEHAGGTGRGGGAPSSSRPGSRRDEQQSDRPDYVAEDEATWQPDEGRNVPPVIADETKNDER